MKILLNSNTADFYTEEAYFSLLFPQLNLYWPFGHCFIKRNFVFCFHGTALIRENGRGEEKRQFAQLL